MQCDFRCLCLLLLFIVWSITTQAETSTEHIIWDKVPIQITLPVGHERLVTFPDDVRLGLPPELTTKLRSLSNGGTVYWLAHEPFEPTRIQVQNIHSGQVYLLDIKAEKTESSRSPIEIIHKADSNSNHPQQRQSKTSRHASLDYVQLTRFAAQQLYAPARLLKTPRGIHRSGVKQRPVNYLIRGQQIEATPIAAWRSGRLFVTAIRLKNQGHTAVELDPRNIRGRWLTATFQHGRLHPAGSELDTTALYLISNRPFEERW